MVAEIYMFGGLGFLIPHSVRNDRVSGAMGLYIIGEETRARDFLRTRGVSAIFMLASSEPPDGLPARVGL